jgi:hypothetical protein
LSAAGTPVGTTTVKRMRLRYRESGLRRLIDTRSRRSSAPLGRTDERVVEAARKALAEGTSRSMGTVDRLPQRVEVILADVIRCR